MSYNDLIEQFKSYRMSHPNLSNCWISYLALKKKHYQSGRASALSARELNCCYYVLAHLLAGAGDIENNDLVRLMLYKFSM